MVYFEWVALDTLIKHNKEVNSRNPICGLKFAVRSVHCAVWCPFLCLLLCLLLPPPPLPPPIQLATALFQFRTKMVSRGLLVTELACRCQRHVACTVLRAIC